MTTKAKTHPLNGMHTAGIFSDMSVDGPEIGTLVLVVDRAKNLPNRKTIGKQDPYCAARLGKEAKKTTTDIRGGQTPKWDQELRFTVHDSSDYYQLKVSVFNDDKKTELIGEAWMDLRDIVVPGGGQSDQWHQLACRGKYAGEVRIEITYYDNRPKPEKPAVKAKPPTPAEAEPTPAAAAAGPRPVPKRRPLPSDPVTGKSPAAPSSLPEQVETPPALPQPNPAPIPHQQAEYNAAAPAPSQSYYQQQDHLRREPSREFGTPSRRADAPTQQYRTPDRAEQYAVQRDQSYSPHYQQPGYDRHDSYDFPPAAGASAIEDDKPPPPPAHRSRTGSNPPSASFQATPPTMRQDVLRSEAHRNSFSGSYPGRPTYKAYDSAPAGLGGPPYTNADQAQPPRHYSFDPAYDGHRTMQATVEDVPESPDSVNNPRRISGRWPQPQPQPQPQSQSQPQPQSKSQPHFEPEYDMAASPAPLTLSGRGSSETASYSQAPDQARYQGSNGYQMALAEIPQRNSPEYAPNFGRHSEPSLPSHGSHSEQRALTYRGEDEALNGYSVPSVPPSLVPGIDPTIAQEISGRINQDRRQSNQARGYTQQALVETPPRGRTMDHGYGHDGSAYNAAPAHSRSPVMYTNGPSTSSVNVVIKSRAYSPNPPRDPSPNPRHQHTIRRKSVSPQPPVELGRRLSAVPFGPDSYDALNPSASTAALKDAAASRGDYSEATGKIITHDGREVDPSDHLPMDTWAPEPEPKQPTSSASSARPSPSGPQPIPSSGRRPLRVAGRPQSMLPSTSSAITYSGSDFVEPVTTTPPASGRNRLQKKAAYRQSTTAIAPVISNNSFRPGSSSSSSHHHHHHHHHHPAPLAPIPPHQDNFTPPRQISRASTQSHGGRHQYSRSGGGGGSSSSYGGPPIPAKVPLALPPPPPPLSSSPSGSAGGMSGALQLHSSSVARRAGTGVDDDEYDDGDGGFGHGHGHGGKGHGGREEYNGYSHAGGRGGHHGGGGETNLEGSRPLAVSLAGASSTRPSLSNTQE
ncbi:hypothetical protein C8A00DRAFT_39304 [Chaetomidium leptoderma]|uniref:C2 domain-containing protein n=1 Tax=Chaetomidium leptoderma TaxID=669021 RepID=A0AAN7A212_9PEZI|nr:hypothetical protein C8A00DRAFT_39304 [Chaetomidium leptoderma]